MPTLVCNTCNAELSDEKVQKLHYRSDWHQYNLKRKLAGAPSVSEASFKFSVETLKTEKGRLDAENLLYTCTVCNKEYRSHKANAQHLRSKLHIQRASQWPQSTFNPITLTRPVPCRPVDVNYEECLSRIPVFKYVKIDVAHDSCLLQADGNSSDEWEEVNDVDDVVSLDSCELDGLDERWMVSRNVHHEDMEIWAPNQCFFCDSVPDGTVEGCVEHMHKQHGFFIPDAEFVKDLEGLLTYLGVKVTKDFMCLYCEDRGRQFSSLEAVRKHMVSKSHCKLRYGNVGQEEELEDFYDFTSSYLPEEDALLVSLGESTTVPVALTKGGAELLIKHDTGTKERVKIIGSRKFLRYYKQKRRPSNAHDSALVNALVTRYQSMGLSTKQSQDQVRNRKDIEKAAAH